jgi:stage II sporulation protein AA (anti-sigma F factor antagonist)
MDHHSAGALRQSIDSSMAAFDCNHLVMDFRGVDLMDSSGIGVVLGRYKRLRTQGGIMCLSGCNQFIRRILEMSGVFTLMEVRDSCEDAEAYVSYKIKAVEQ